MNGFFRLMHEAGKTSLKIYPPTDGGEALQPTEAADYLVSKNITFEKNTLYKAVLDAASEGAKESVVLLDYKDTIPQRESYKLIVSDDKMSATVRFYAPSVGGAKISPESFLQDLESQGIRHGILKNSIVAYFKQREFCKDIPVARGTEPIQGQDAFIEYFFDTDRKAKPTLKEDGSVDFFQLNLVHHCGEGEVLARMTPGVPGEPGMDVYGEKIKPRDIRTATLKFGKNIAISEDKTELTSLVNGHVELVEGTVFVSNVLTVENVDTSTGNIDYDGSVQVNGNVCTNFQVKAKDNVEVRGVVEGAIIEAGGDIIIARGMNAMGRGKLKAGGNIVVKFLENAHAEAEGYVAAESILYSTVVAGTDINVDGRRGFISGGTVRAGHCVEVKSLGSSMGGDTTVEVGALQENKEKLEQLQAQIEEDTKFLQSLQGVVAATKQKMSHGVKLSAEQVQYFQTLSEAGKQKQEELAQNVEKVKELQDQMLNMDGVCVIVRNTVYPGTKICIGDVSTIIQKEAQYCRFIKSQGDVKLTGI